MLKMMTLISCMAAGVVIVEPDQVNEFRMLSEFDSDEVSSVCRLTQKYLRLKVIKLMSLR